MALGIGSTWTRACGRWRRAWAGDGAAKADAGWPCVLVERGLHGEPVDVDAIIRQWSAHPFMDFFVAVELLRLQCREAPPRRGPPPA